MEIVKFVYCTGYRCSIKDTCLRYKKHKERLAEVGDKKAASKNVDYVKSTACTRNGHNNFLAID